MRRLLWGGFAGAACGDSSRPVFGTDSVGRIFGTVFDQQELVAPGVRITATNKATQEAQYAGANEWLKRTG